MPAPIPVPPASPTTAGPAAPVRVLFVCLGNICRSPLAEGVFQHLVAEAGLAERVQVDSAGTGAWHVGDPPDRRMRDTARRHGLSLETLRARQIRHDDFRTFDLVLAMDRQVLHDLHALHPGAEARLALFRDYDPKPDETLEVPDPYYGGPEGFEKVYRIVHRTCQVLVADLQRTLVAEGR